MLSNYFLSWDTVRISGPPPLSAAQESGILKVQ